MHAPPLSQLVGITNGDGDYNCELCGYTARNWSKMKEHMIRHSEGTPFACSYCDSKYKRPADLNRHLKIKHNTCLADIGLDGPTLKGVMAPSHEGKGLSTRAPTRTPPVVTSVVTGNKEHASHDLFLSLSPPLHPPVACSIHISYLTACTNQPVLLLVWPVCCCTHHIAVSRLAGLADSNSPDSNMPSLKRAYPPSGNDDGGDIDSEGDDPKRLCIDEDGYNLQCTKCSYLAKWKSDLERHMKVSSVLSSSLRCASHVNFLKNVIGCM